MKEASAVLQLVVSRIGFLLVTFMSGMIGSHAIEDTQDPSFLNKTIYALTQSVYPFVIIGFLLWAVVAIVVWIRKRNLSI
ncbi:hypothetical protein AM500_04070 [Bacillus sp. FJAT-18017]|uniref:hypothetical protein n=1 Tax=Bacillus sp. FJAT-18017 TaxID=1705566 RepID=UPI0006ADFB75|nr:hypothetical protein [Bacillus sp. FJAT-18017]ALC89058.1 hypothetical protein AM500_04070 [Bacillus sp. FJAT-18017]